MNRRRSSQVKSAHGKKELTDDSATVEDHQKKLAELLKQLEQAQDVEIKQKLADVVRMMQLKEVSQEALY